MNTSLDPLAVLFVRKVYHGETGTVYFGGGTFYAELKRNGSVEKYELTLEQMKAHTEDTTLPDVARQLAKALCEAVQR